MNPLDHAIRYVKGVGPKLEAQFNKLNITTVSDLLCYFPRDYDDRRTLPKLSELHCDEVQSIIGVIESVVPTQRHRLSIIKCQITDGHHRITAVWFNQPFRLATLVPGTRIYIRGKVVLNTYAQTYELHVAETELIRTDDSQVKGIHPIYPITGRITQLKMRAVIKTACESYLHYIQDPIPELWRKKWQLGPLKKAIKEMHFPETIESMRMARARFVFEDFFYFQLALQQRRRLSDHAIAAEKLIIKSPMIQSHLHALPYALTAAQKNAVQAVARDVTSGKPMNRLIQGDVGCGKTDVAVLALLFAVASGKKGVLMAPTEILAEQHYYKISKYLIGLGVPVFLLKGRASQKDKKTATAKLQEQEPCIVIGTHALIQASVNLGQVGLAVIDEQHRFGVLQRMQFRNQNPAVHCLFLTATPIPRTFMLTLYGDLDKTIINEMPPGRTPPQTHFVREEMLAKVYTACQRELAENQQIYIVFPLIEESEKIDLRSAVEGYKEIKQLFPNQSVGLLHGQLPSKEKTVVMDAFKANKIQILVSTTVIEVGVDVPNATTMIILHAERFGLAQLHQLRGRIGRGHAASRCYLVANPKTDSGKKRIQAMLKTTDGFKIAEYDLKIRGPGEMMGVRQAGMPEFKVADLILDEAALLEARQHADTLLQHDPLLEDPDHHMLKLTMAAKYAHFIEQKLN